MSYPILTARPRIAHNSPKREVRVEWNHRRIIRRMDASKNHIMM